MLQSPIGRGWLSSTGLLAAVLLSVLAHDNQGQTKDSSLSTVPSLISSPDSVKDEGYQPIPGNPGHSSISLGTQMFLIKLRRGWAGPRIQFAPDPDNPVGRPLSTQAPCRVCQEDSGLVFITAFHLTFLLR